MSPRELAKVYDEHAQALFGYLMDFTGNEADARDLLQELFVRLARGGALNEAIRSERGWLLRMARNLAVDLIRRRGTRDRNYEAFRAEVSGISPAPDPDERAFQTALESALSELPLEQREVVHLKAWAGLTFEEIAETLQISQNTAASRYRYGLDKLRTRLRPLYEEIQ
jgi:RNA polymerase sigma-70 factor (ECF subfamily)